MARRKGSKNFSKKRKAIESKLLRLLKEYKSFIKEADPEEDETDLEQEPAPEPKKRMKPAPEEKPVPEPKKRMKPAPEEKPVPEPKKQAEPSQEPDLDTEPVDNDSEKILKKTKIELFIEKVRDNPNLMQYITTNDPQLQLNAVVKFAELVGLDQNRLLSMLAMQRKIKSSKK